MTPNNKSDGGDLIITFPRQYGSLLKSRILEENPIILKGFFLFAILYFSLVLVQLKINEAIRHLKNFFGVSKWSHILFLIYLVLMRSENTIRISDITEFLFLLSKPQILIIDSSFNWLIPSRGRLELFPSIHLNSSFWIY